MDQNGHKMNITLKKKLDLLRPIPERSIEQAKIGKAKFMTEASAVVKGVSQVRVLRHKGWFDKFSSRKERYVMVKAFTIILIVVVAALSGTGAVAAASQSSLPDQALYSVKIWTEDLRIGLASASAEDTLNLALDFASRRVTEISTLTDQGVITPDSVATRLEIEIYQAYQAITQLQGDALAQALLRTEATLRTQEETMLRLNTNSQTEPVCSRTRNMIQQQIRLFEGNKGDATALQSQIRLQLQTNKPADAGNSQGAGQNSTLSQGTPQPGSGNGNGSGGNMYLLTGTPSGGYGNGNMYYLTGTPVGGFGYGYGYCTIATADAYGNIYYNNSYYSCLTRTPMPGESRGSGGGSGGKP